MVMKRYEVLPFEGLDGIERGTDPPVGRRIYRPGDIIELDEKLHGVAGLLANGQIRPVVEPVVQPVPSKAKADES